MLYSAPKYGSINLSAIGYWTDGRKEHALTPDDGGLRKCKCGEFYLLREATSLSIETGPETPRTQFVDAADLADATRSSNKSVELVARRQYWMHLNDSYRALYRAHRQAQDTAAQEKWDSNWRAANPDRRSALRKIADLLLRKKSGTPPPMGAYQFSAPLYQPSVLQTQNMERMLGLILEQTHEPFGGDFLEVAELYRELGRFSEAAAALCKCPAYDIGVPEKLMARLIDVGQRAPVRLELLASQRTMG